jgi:hypothetical protein
MFVIVTKAAICPWPRCDDCNCRSLLATSRLSWRPSPPTLRCARAPRETSPQGRPPSRRRIASLHRRCRQLPRQTLPPLVDDECRLWRETFRLDTCNLKAGVDVGTLLTASTILDNGRRFPIVFNSTPHWSSGGRYPAELLLLPVDASRPKGHASCASGRTCTCCQMPSQHLHSQPVASTMLCSARQLWYRWPGTLGTLHNKLPTNNEPTDGHCCRSHASWTGMQMQCGTLYLHSFWSRQILH